jgi:hydroxylamine reductase (hybrid-cluster protein)
MKFEEQMIEAEIEEEAEEEEELTEFRYKGKDYYMDAECNVYEADSDGDVTQVGVYNEVTRKITFNN